jgi:hypothetical protein
MTSYQFVIHYRSIKAERYFKVTSIWLGANNAAALDIILGVMCGIIQDPADMRAKFEYNRPSIRPMGHGDIVEVAGKAYICCVTDTCVTYFDEFEYRADHQYGNAQGWEFEQVYNLPEWAQPATV